MRICLVSQEYPPETAHGGIATQTHMKAHGLRARGHEICVVSASTDLRRHDYLDGDVRVVRIPGFDARMDIHDEAVRWLTYSAEVAATVADLHAEFAFDLVDFPEWAAESFVYLLNRTPEQRLPVVVHIHGPLVMLAHAIGWPDKDSEMYRIGTFMEAACLRMADAAMSSSVCSALWCAEHYGLATERVPVLHTGVDTELFKPDAAAKNERPTVVFVGKLATNKGAVDLVDACCRLARTCPELRLRMVGRSVGSMDEQLAARAIAAGCPELLELAGPVDRRALAAELASAHLLAVPSHYEGGPGFVYLEAMACGLPVIACAGSGAAGVVRDGETGLLVSPGDVDALAEALRMLVAEPERRHAMGEHALEYARREADSRVCVEHIERFYADVVAGRAGRPPQS